MSRDAWMQCELAKLGPSDPKRAELVKRERHVSHRKTSIKDTGAGELAAAKLDVDILDVRENPIGEAGGAALRAAYGDRLVLTDADIGKAPASATATAQAK